MEEVLQCWRCGGESHWKETPRMNDTLQRWTKNRRLGCKSGQSNDSCLRPHPCCNATLQCVQNAASICPGKPRFFECNWKCRSVNNFDLLMEPPLPRPGIWWDLAGVSLLDPACLACLARQQWAQPAAAVFVHSISSGESSSRHSVASENGPTMSVTLTFGKGRLAGNLL